MPIFEFFCESCNAEFEETLINSEEIKKYKDAHPCPGCRKLAPRAGVSITNFSFKGGVRGESGVHGQSGVHDLDYPTLDKAIARSSEKRWTRINSEQAERDKIRRETGSIAISKEPGKQKNVFRPASTEALRTREMGMARYLVEKGKEDK